MYLPYKRLLPLKLPLKMFVSFLINSNKFWKMVYLLIYVGDTLITLFCENFISSEVNLLISSSSINNRSQLRVVRLSVTRNAYSSQTDVDDRLDGNNP